MESRIPYLVIQAVNLYGEQIKPSEESKSSYIEKIEDFISGKVALPEDKDVSKKDNFIFPKIPHANLLDKKTSLKYQKSMQAYYDYRVRGFEHRSKVFEWQLFSSKLLFVVVLGLVFLGVYFAKVQFYEGLKDNKKNIETNKRNTRIVFSRKSIEISSPMIGVIILAISLGFFIIPQ